MRACPLGAAICGFRRSNKKGLDISLSICHIGPYGVVAAGTPWFGSARRQGAPDMGRAGTPSLGPAGRDASLPVVSGPVRQGPAPCRDPGGRPGLRWLAGRRAR